MTKIAIIEDDIGLNKGIELALKREDYVNMFYLVGGALAAVLALIGILNFINAIVTGMLARQQEFAMMEAVGMTERQLAHMLVWEGICYAIFTMVFAIAANCLVGRFLIEGLAGDIWFFTYQPTIAPLLACLPVLIVLAAVIPYLASRSLHRRSVVERMRIAEYGAITTGCGTEAVRCQRPF